MSERWIYQIRIGIFWGLFMAVFNALFEMKEHPILEQFISPRFYIRTAVYILAGIFIMGYISWKEKAKRQNNKQ